MLILSRKSLGIVGAENKLFPNRNRTHNHDSYSKLAFFSSKNILDSEFSTYLTPLIKVWPLVRVTCQKQDVWKKKFFRGLVNIYIFFTWIFLLIIDPDFLSIWRRRWLEKWQVIVDFLLLNYLFCQIFFKTVILGFKLITLINRSRGV